MQKTLSDPDFVDTVVNVRYAETDQMGIAYYANYLVWFEVGRGAWCRASLQTKDP
jgi:acyl-CoA thioester hydrolase